MTERIHSRVTTVSWIPSESVTGGAKGIFATVSHYDDPPPDRLTGADTAAQGDTLDTWRTADRFRFANQLGAWITVEGGRITAAGYDGEGRIGSTRLGVGRHGVTVTASTMPIIQPPPELGDGPSGPWARFTQTWGGRTGVPAPRRVNHPPFVQIQAPLVWTTLALTIHADGTTSHEVAGASRFPRHWVYDAAGELVAKSGSTDYKDWWRHAFGRHTPWGDTDTPAFVALAESALERELSTGIMRRGAKPSIRSLAAGALLTEQGTPDASVHLVLDGILTVEVDGEAVAEIGPGAVAGERAGLETGLRTATLRAQTACRVATVAADQLDPVALSQLREGHRREEAR